MLGRGIQVISKGCRRQPDRRAWLGDQAHSGFMRSAAALPLIAWNASRDDVFPAFGAALHDGNDMIERQLMSRAFASAILAGMPVAQKRVRAGKSNHVSFANDRDIAAQAQYGGKPERDRYRADYAIVLLKNLHLVLNEQDHRFLPGNYFERFERSVQDEDRVHTLDYKRGGNFVQ